MASPVNRPITALVFNSSKAEAAVSFYDSAIITVVGNCAEADPAKWTKTATLRQHNGCVSGLDWHPVKDRILSCGHDRSAYVWVRQAKGTAPEKRSGLGIGVAQDCDGWVPQMVVLSAVIKRGLTSCAWSPSGDKLYVGSAAAHVAVGRFDAQEGWWVCRVLSTHQSTVAALAPHPRDNALLASGGFDGLVILQSSLMKKVDGKECGAAAFGTVYQTNVTGAWVHAMAWNSAGDRLAVASHDSSLHIFTVDESALGEAEDCAKALPAVTVRFSALPMVSLSFWGTSNDQIITAGEDYFPASFTYDACADRWGLSTVGVVPNTTKQSEESNASADPLQRLLAKSGTRHHRTIRAIQVVADDAFITAGMDGKILRWQTKDLVSL